MKRSCKLAFALLFLLALLASCGRSQSVPASGSGADRSSAGSASSESPPDVPDPPPAGSSHSEEPDEPEPGLISEPDPDPGPEAVPQPERDPEPENTELYVLMYHDFVPEGSPYNNWMLTDARFREDLRWLADHGWTTVLPSQLAAGEPLPERAVMLTFDDGYDSNYTLAYPILKEFQAKAVISIIGKGVYEGVPGFLTWDMCREMDQSGLVEFGSHTYASHDGSENGIRRLEGESQADYEARVLPDLQLSIYHLTEALGKPPLVFAYPNGVKEPWAEGFIQDHFSITLTTKHGPSDISNGLYDLRRCNVSMEVPVSKILPS